MTHRERVQSIAEEMAEEYNRDRTWSAHLEPKYFIWAACIAVKYMNRGYELGWYEGKTSATLAHGKAIHGLLDC